MRTVVKMLNGFVMHGMEPDWIARGSGLSAWYDHEGNVLDAELINTRNQSRPVKQCAALWNYAIRQGRVYADTKLTRP